MTDKRLVCTNCDTVAAATAGYDGYGARCSCDRAAFRTGNSADLPPSWKRVDDVGDPTNFSVWCEGHIRTGGEMVETPDVECIGHTCDGEGKVTVMLESVDLLGYDVKATFTCHGEHGLSERENISVAYYRENSHTLAAIREWADD